MSNIQKNIDELFKQNEQTKKELNDLTSSIIGRNQEQLNQLIEAQQKEQVQKQQELNNLTNNIMGRNQVELEQLIQAKKREMETSNYTSEEIMYINSGYYNYYKYILDNADKLFIESLKEIASNYEKNRLHFHNPFHNGLSSSIITNSFGYPIPQRFLDELEYVISNNMKNQTYINFEDGEFDAKIVPINYTYKSENVAKQVNSYEIKIILKQKSKTDNNSRSK